MLHQQHITGSRFLLNVEPNVIAPDACVGTGGGLTAASAGKQARFALQALDAFGNCLSPPLDAFEVNILGEESPISLPAAGKALGDGR
jgi:hypothetical protein